MAGGKRRANVNATGRNDDRVGSEERSLIIRRSFWHSPHVAALSSAGRALLVELHSMFNGTNNGTLFLSVRDCADRLGFADLEAAMNAIADLESIGLVTVTVEGSFSMKAGETSRARAFQLNWIGAEGKCTAADKLPPLDFSKLSGKQKKRIEARSGALARYLNEQRQRKLSVRETRTLMAGSVRESRTEAAHSVRESRTPESENGGNPSTHIVRESLTHILHHIPDAVSEGVQDNPTPKIADDPKLAALELRQKIGAYWGKLSSKQRRAWAEAHGLTRDDVQDYCIGDPDRLPPAKVAALLLSIRNEKAARKAA
jgi:hypothetical protein